MHFARNRFGLAFASRVPVSIFIEDLAFKMETNRSIKEENYVEGIETNEMNDIINWVGKMLFSSAIFFVVLRRP